MVQMIQKISFIVITSLIGVILSANAFNIENVSASVVIPSKSVNNTKANATAVLPKKIVSFVNIIDQTCIVANIFDAVEEVIEEDEDTECTSLKKHPCANSQYSITQKVYQKAGAYHFYSPKSWYGTVPLTAISTTSKYLLFCVFKI
jgi:hypothetical protein